jgi:hypothetical protein
MALKRPYTGGRPASTAYDMPCHTTHQSTEQSMNRQGDLPYQGRLISRSTQLLGKKVYYVC